MIYIGKVVSTQGIKGEIRILSDFEYKDKVFVVGNSLYIQEKKYKIQTYRKHKNFDMVTLNDYNNINDVLHLMKEKVYFREEDLKLDDNEILDDELVKYNVITTDGKKGKVLEIFFASPSNKIIRTYFDKEILIPMNSPMLVKIDKNKKQILIDLVDGM